MSFLQRLLKGNRDAKSEPIQTAGASASLTIPQLCAGLGAPDDVLHFAHVPGGEVLFGPGTLDQLGDKAKAIGGTRALVVTDPGLRTAGHEDRTVKYLRDAGIEVFIFDEVRENPTTKDVDNCVAVAKGHQIDMIVGLGGGSSMDTAKGANFILTNGGRMQDYWGKGKAKLPMLPLIAIPTTAGTGSECQSFALIADEETHVKMACGDKKAAAALSILDPELTITQPPKVTANTGIDAIAHALETAVCRTRSEISSAYSSLAFHLLNTGFEQVLADPQDLSARARMQLGAAYAGTAIENSMLGAAHATANPLTAKYNVIHGQAVGLMLPHVVRWNRAKNPDAAAIYDALLPNLEERVSHLLALAGMPQTLSGLSVPESDFPGLARDASKQWTAQFNAAPIGAIDFAEIYAAAY